MQHIHSNSRWSFYSIYHSILWNSSNSSTQFTKLNKRIREIEQNSRWSLYSIYHGSSFWSISLILLFNLPWSFYSNYLSIQFTMRHLSVQVLLFNFPLGDLSIQSSMREMTIVPDSQHNRQFTHSYTDSHMKTESQHSHHFMYSYMNSYIKSRSQHNRQFIYEFGKLNRTLTFRDFCESNLVLFNFFLDVIYHTYIIIAYRTYHVMSCHTILFHNTFWVEQP